MNTSVVSQSVTVEHTPDLSVDDIKQALDEAGFDLVTSPQFEKLRVNRASAHFADWVKRKREKHAEQCLLCQQDGAAEAHAGTSDTLVSRTDPSSKNPSLTDTLNLGVTMDKVTYSNKESPERIVQGGSGPFTATFSVGGMTCASCITNVSRILDEIPGVSNGVVSLLGKSATATLEDSGLVGAVIEGVEDGGYDCELVSMEPMKTQSKITKPKENSDQQGPFIATFSVGGMTCASCIVNVSQAMSGLEGVSDVAVNLVGKSATAKLESRDLANLLVDAIEDGGYDAELVSIDTMNKEHEDEAGPRTVSLKVDGMFCQYVFSFI